MDLMEYQARAVFEKYGIPQLNGTLVNDLSELSSKAAGLTYPLVVKAQVQTGGRGKAGGVKFASDADGLKKCCESIFGMNIRGRTVRKVLLVEKAKRHDECYLSITLDRAAKCPAILFSACGGVDIEQVAGTNPQKIVKAAINPFVGVTDYTVRYIIDESGMDISLLKPLGGLIRNLYRAFTEYDCLLAEINPLAVTDDAGIAALDAKMTVDDSALYRQPEILADRDMMEEDPLAVEARRFRFLYIPCDPDGDVNVMSNGSGMIMSCVDLISDKGMKVGAGLDLGGGATSDRIAEAVRIMLSGKNTKALFISIFGGITRCDEVAEGIRLAMLKQPAHKLVVVRMEGTNRDRGLEILRRAGDRIIPVEDIKDGVNQLSRRRSIA